MAQAASLVWLAVGAALLGVVARVAIPPITWIALAVILHASRGMPTWPGGGAVWLALYLALLVGNRGNVPIPGVGYFAIIGFVTTTVALPFIVDRVVAVKLGAFGSTLVFPLAFVAAEFLRTRFAPPASWYSIAYTQYGNLPLMQLAAFAGLSGITFVVAWFASTLDLAWTGAFAWNAVKLPIILYAATLGAIAIGGSVRLAWAPTNRPSMRVATLNRPADLFVPGEITRIAEGRLSPDERPRLTAKLTKLHDAFLEGSRREARAGARLIVWPETSLLILAENEPAFLARARRLAADEHVDLAMGMGTVTIGAPLPLENKLVLIDGAGQVLVSYRKSHPVPGWEASLIRPGDGRLPVVATHGVAYGGAICFDIDFPEFVRQAAEQRADLLVVPVNEWRAIKDVHFQMHAFRAIESGVPLVRAAAAGLSAAFDSWGRLIAVADDFAEGDRTLVAEVPIGAVRTLYGTIGDLFAWICVAGLGFVLIRDVAMRF